jgi:hypothetical protein
MKRYGIADYLTAGQRFAICRARYDQFGATHKQRITDLGCCPLGVLPLPYAHELPAALGLVTEIPPA